HLDDRAQLALRADEEHAVAPEHDLADRLLRDVQTIERLAQVDDVDAVALGEDEGLHLRIPTARLVAEVDSGFQEMVELNVGHEARRYFFYGADYAPVRIPARGVTTHGTTTSNCVLALGELEAL